MQILTDDIVRLASDFGRYGYRRITAFLQHGGWKENHKKVEGIWRLEGLKIPGEQPERARLWLMYPAQTRQAEPCLGLRLCPSTYPKR